MEVYFKIGEIADMFSISVRALHLYDKMGLFIPEYTDEATGYRYYTPDQVEKLNTILSFKKIGFSLAEIKNLFDDNLNEYELLNVLNRKAVYFEHQIDIATFNIENIKRMIMSIEETGDKSYKNNLSEEEWAIKMSHMACLENIKFENLLSEILWL